MDIDTKIFSPDRRADIDAGQTVRITGAAFGGTRVAKVEVTADLGATWTDATIVEQMDADNVWVFWEAEIRFPETGIYTVNARATDIHGVTQQENDPNRYDGNNDWPMLRVNVQ